MKKRICKKALCVLLTAALLLAAFAPSVFAESAFFETNSDEWHYRYYYSSGTIELCYHHYRTSENVVIPDKIGAVPVTGFVENPAEYFYTVMLADEKIKTISFDLQLTELPESFAANCLNLERVTLPDSLTSIPEKAFYNCVKLSAINLPAGLKSIGSGAFLYCKSLDSITLPQSLRTIDGSAFNSCSRMTAVTLPPSMRSVGDSAFANCTALQTVTVNNGVQQIGACAFSLCSSLTAISLPDSVTVIGAEAFRNCRALQSAVLPNALTVISAGMFRDCLNLETVNIPYSVYDIQGNAFCGCRKLDNVTLPSGLRLLEDRAFADCRSLSAITIPGSVRNVAAGAFYGCTGLKTVVMQYGVHTIGEHEEGYEGESSLGRTFANCSPDMTITLPISVITVCKESFDGIRKKYIDGEKRFLDRIDFASDSDKAGFKYRVPFRFVSEHGETPATRMPYVGEEIMLPSMTAQGYIFRGWLFGGERHTGSYTVPSDPVEMTASWDALENTVTFITYEGVTPRKQSIYTGDAVSEPGGQIIGSEYLAGWYKTQDCTGEPYDFSEPVCESFNLYAKWEPAPLVEVHITGDGDGNSVVFRDSRDDAAYASFTSSGSAYVPADAKMVVTAADGVSYSGMIQSQIPTGNAGAVFSRTMDVVDGTSVYTPEYGTSARVDVAFSAAPTVSDNSVYDGGSDTSRLWSLIDGYDFIYENGSEVNVPTGDVVPLDAQMTLKLTVPDGYGCDGTILNGGNTIRIDDGKTSVTFMPAGSITLNLHYYSRKNYTTLTFLNTNNADQFFTQKYPKTEMEPVQFEVPACPYTHSTGVFDHWLATVNGVEKQFCFGETPSVPQEDTVFSTVWRDVRFISFNRNGGTGSMEKQAASFLDSQGGTSRYFTVLLDCAFTRSGYVFTGWNTKANGSGAGYQPHDVITVTANTTLYAQWTKAYTVMLYPNGADGDCLRQEIARGDSAAIADVPFTRAGCVLTGWNTSADGSGTAYALGETITPEGDMSLYARWQADALQLDPVVMLVIDPAPNGGRLQTGHAYRLTASYPDLGLPADVTWVCSQPDVLTVDGNGNCTVVKNGFATVTAMDAAGKAARAELIVFASDPNVRIAGDVDMDGEVTAQDVVLTTRSIAGGWNARILTENADVNGDGMVDLKDVVLIRRFLAGGWNVTLQ